MLGDGRAHVLRADLADHVADEHAVARGGALHDRRGAAHTGDGAQLRLHLAQLEPPTGELDLVVAAAHELEAIDRLAHDVAGAVGALPAERRQAGVALRVELRVEVAPEPHASDHKLTGLAQRHRRSRVVHHRHLPAGERPPDHHRAAGAHRRGGRHDRRLGGAIGVPDLAAGRRRDASRAPARRPRRRGSAGARSRACARPTSRPASAPWRSR